MQPTFNSVIQYHPFYKENGLRITTTNAQNRIAQIRKINEQNSGALQKIRLGRMKVSGKIFPDKFSQDIYDGQITCEIERMLIERIFDLEKENNLYLESQVKMVGEYERQNLTLQEKLKLANKEKKKLNEQLNKERDVIANMKLKIDNFAKIEKDLQIAKRRVNDLERVLQRQRLANLNKIHHYNDGQTRQRMLISKCTNKKNVQILNPAKPTNVINNFTKVNEAKKNAKSLKELFQKQHDQNFDRIENQNNKLKIWLQKYINQIKSILQIRLQKLKQNGISDQQIRQTYKYLGKMESHAINFLNEDYFPFEELFEDFCSIVQFADENHIMVQKLKQVNQAKALDRSLVNMAVEELRNFNGQLLKGLKWIMGEHQLVKKEYERFMRADLSGIEWIQEFNPRENMQFRNLPSKILGDLRKLVGFAKEKDRIIKEQQRFNARCAISIENIDNESEQFMNGMQQKKSRSKYIQEVAKEFRQNKRGMMKKIDQQMFVNIDETMEERQKRWNGIDLDVSLRIFKQKQEKAKNEISLNNPPELMGPVKTPPNLKKTVMETSKSKKNLIDEAIQGRELKKRQELEMEMKKIQVQKKKPNQVKDVQI